jgi:hypothetical protein
LLDDVTAKIGIDRTADRSIDGSRQAGISNAVPPREFRKCPRLENTHQINL